MAEATMPHRRFFDMDIASRAATLSFGSNLLLMIVKVTIGLVFGSVAVLGDGIDSAEDVFASALAFFAVRMAIQPADSRHPFGHGKAEGMAALAQALLIAAGAVFIAAMAVYRLATGGVEIYVVPSIITMLITVAVNLAVALYAMRAARISGSVAIASDARHLMTNIVQAGAVIAALVLVGVTGDRWWDPAMALLLSAYLLWIAFTIARDAFAELLDESLPEEDLQAIEERLSGMSGSVRGYHGLRTRKSGREKYIEAHVLVDPATSVSDAHRCIEEIEQELVTAVPGAIVNLHIDPDEPGIMQRAPQRQPVEQAGRLHGHKH
jgi:cation diffusion facilitator family transporter